MTLMADVDPINHHEDLMNKEWKKAMKEELTAIERNYTWELINFPYDKNDIKVK